MYTKDITIPVGSGLGMGLITPSCETLVITQPVVLCEVKFEVICSLLESLTPM